MRIINYFAAIRLETVIDIMQVDARRYTDHAIKDTRGKSFRERFQAWVLPARHQIIALVQFLQETGNLFRVILQITIHRKDHFATRTPKTSYQRGCFTKITPEAHHTHYTTMGVVELFQFPKGTIRTPIIHKNNFVVLAQLI